MNEIASGVNFIWIVSYLWKGSIVVSAFDNEEAAKKFYNYTKKMSRRIFSPYRKVTIDSAPIFNQCNISE